VQQTGFQDVEALDLLSIACFLSRVKGKESKRKVSNMHQSQLFYTKCL
jgi:hypothetical protein